jgi:hypothetical protein
MPVQQMKRIMALFSCGAASAVATKLAIARFAEKVPLVILNNHVSEEHPDNGRFLKDCEKWFGIKIDVATNEKYEGSIYNVFQKERFIKSARGAPCTRLLKRKLRDDMMLPGDVIIVGFTCEEQDRFDRFQDSNNEYEVIAPLIEANLTKGDCLGMIDRAGIEIPEMYRLGYRNNNCIGCVKGGMGYWNKIRADFPDTFSRMAEMEQILGAGSYLFAPDKEGGKRRSLLGLDPRSGNYPTEPDISCGVFCEMAESDYRTEPL